MNSGVISLRLTGKEKDRLDILSRQTGRSRAFYLREALSKYLDELEHIYAVRAEHEAIRKEELQTISLEELERELLED